VNVVPGLVFETIGDNTYGRDTFFRFHALARPLYTVARPTLSTRATSPTLCRLSASNLANEWLAVIRLAVFELVTLEPQRTCIFGDRPLYILRKARVGVGINFKGYPDFSLAGLPKLTHDRLGDVTYVP
jgi:hypothetical protein